jgi:hypothetical protein
VHLIHELHNIDVTLTIVVVVLVLAALIVSK